MIPPGCVPEIGGFHGAVVVVAAVVPPHSDKTSFQPRAGICSGVLASLPRSAPSGAGFRLIESGCGSASGDDRVAGWAMDLRCKSCDPSATAMSAMIDREGREVIPTVMSAAASVVARAETASACAWRVEVTRGPVRDYWREGRTGN